ncbi:GntR family transcriptional regulator YhfZ [Lactobacillus sp. YT155]|uniref:GntR family transcriptional regulator YhfZ n=1 Tax=Lactobacillus sp. YT155 TaxID=3060955 RepID=UPI00265DDFA8|nr:GntR family transcriptional regulator YhfZ [Lactobacillus sp. YT155]MDO1604942.1 GntR family transcriptional regulator YhfZ [Lactobacillus sp. YT155]
MNEKNYRKESLAVIYLAKRFLDLTVGSRIPSIDELTADSEFSRGTIQNGLTTLKEEKAITIKSHGYQGSVLVNLDRLKLLKYTDFDFLVGSMPLPYTKKYEGLAGAIYKYFRANEINFNMAYVNGSVNRVQGLLDNRFNFSIVSELSADFFISKYPELEKSLILDKETFVSEHILMVTQGIKNGIKEIKKVGIDNSSEDFRVLTKLVFDNREVEYEEIPYNQIVEKVRLGEVDAAIWNKDELIARNNPCDFINLKKFSVPDEVIEKANSAVFLTKASDKYVGNTLRLLMKKQSLKKFQESVENEEILPEY